MLADTQIETSIIIPTRNHADMLIRLVDGLRSTVSAFKQSVELIIVDNNSDQTELLQFLEALSNTDTGSEFAAVTILPYPHKFNYSAINNLAVASSRGKNLCFLNNDIEIFDTHWLSELQKPQDRADTGCVGAMLYYPDNTIQHAGVYLDEQIIAEHLYKHEKRGAKGQGDYLLHEQEVRAVTAACMLVSRQIFDEIGGFDESLSVAFNDIDFCLKVRQAGYRNIWTPAAQLYHHESKSRGLSHQRSFMQKLNHKKEIFLMKQRWRTELRTDQHHPDLQYKSDQNTRKRAH